MKKLFFLTLLLLLCSLVTPVSASAAELIPTPEPEITEAAEPDATSVPTEAPEDADATPVPEEPKPTATPVPQPDWIAYTDAMLEAQAFYTEHLEEAKELQELLQDAWNQIRFWATAIAAFWFSKKSWRGVD
ncbi:MAG: hypothetical protein IJY09_06390 [Lachnospiraceae bacterium]|nr:hypothetical protein [Lachnospiraceae bacterium]